LASLDTAAGHDPSPALVTLQLYNAGGVDLMRLKSNPQDLSFFSALTLLVGFWPIKISSPIWPIMCLVGR